MEESVQAESGGEAGTVAGLSRGVVLALNYIAAAVVDERVPVSVRPAWMALAGADVKHEDFEAALRLITDTGSDDLATAGMALEYLEHEAELAAFTACGRSANVFSVAVVNLKISVPDNPESLVLVVRFTSAVRQSHISGYSRSGGEPYWHRVVRIRPDPENFAECLYDDKQTPYQV